MSQIVKLIEVNQTRERRNGLLAMIKIDKRMRRMEHLIRSKEADLIQIKGEHNHQRMNHQGKTLVIQRRRKIRKSILIVMLNIMDLRMVIRK